MGLNFTNGPVMSDMSYNCANCAKHCSGETSKLNPENERKVLRTCPHCRYKEERDRDTHENFGTQATAGYANFIPPLEPAKPKRAF